MPDYRKLHNSAGHGEKPSRLTDFEFRVWIQMRASSDDFGVGPVIPGKLQGDNRYLARKPVGAVQRAMQTVIGTKLLETFQHQGQTYYFQADWQDWESVTYPRRSIYPYPPIEKISERTRKLIEDAEESFSKKSSKVSKVTSGGFQTSLTPNPNTNNQHVTVEDVPAPIRVLDTPIIKRRKPWCAFEGARLEVPQRWHDDHVKRLGGDDPDRALTMWYGELDASLVESRGAIDKNVFKWLDERYEHWASKASEADLAERYRPKGA